MVNAGMLVVSSLAANSTAPEELITRKNGPLPAAKGLPLTWLSVPVFALTEKAETSLSLTLAE